MDIAQVKPLELNDGPVVYDLFISMIAVMSLVIVIGMLVVQKQTEMFLLLSYLDLGICVIFFIDFIRNLVKAPSKLDYLRGWGLLDLAASVPVMDVFRFLRLARLIRVVRGIKSVRILTRTVRSDRRNALLALVMFVVISGIIVSCVGVLFFEQRAPAEAEANILTAGNALWWAICTASTVGYGDFYPVTTGGRLFAVLLMSLGIGTFASFAGLMTDLVRHLSKPIESKAEELADKQAPG